MLKGKAQICILGMCVFVCVCVCVSLLLLKYSTRRQTERQVKGIERKMLEACLWEGMVREDCVSVPSLY